MAVLLSMVMNLPSHAPPLFDTIFKYYCLREGRKSSIGKPKTTDVLAPDLLETPNDRRKFFQVALTFVSEREPPGTKRKVTRT